MEKKFSYRITKIAGRAVAVAMCALTGMVIMGGAQAAEVYLGTSYFPNPGLASSSAGFLSTTSVNNNGTPNDGSTASSAIFYDGIDAWNVSTNGYYFDNDTGRWRILGGNTVNPGYSSSVSRAGDVFYGNIITYWRNDVASQNNTAWTVATSNDAGYSFDAVRNSEFISNTFGAIVDSGSNNYNFAVGSDVSSRLRGAKAYTYIGDFTPDYNFQATGTAAFIFVDGSAAVQNSTGRAIEIAGSANFAGGNTIDGGASAQSFTIAGNNSVFNGAVAATAAVDVNGNSNVFNGTVNADQVNLSGDATNFAGNVTVANGLNFLNGVTASMTNGADIGGTVSFGAHDGTLRLSNTSNINGAVTTSGMNGALIFEGTSTVTGNIGLANAGIRQMDLNGNSSRTVTLEGMSYVNLVNINAAGNLVIGTGQAGDGLNTTGVMGGRVDFNNTAGTVTLTDLGSIAGQIVSTGGSNGAGGSVANTVNFAQNGTMTGNIGTFSGNRIGAVNVGSVAAGTVNMTGDLYAVALNITGGSTLNITGDVTAATTLSTTAPTNSTLSVTRGNVVGNVTTDYDTLGTLTLTGLTLTGGNLNGEAQTVTGDMGTNIKRLAAVNAGANSANTTLNGNVFATNLNVTGTGTVNLNGDFTGTSVAYLAAGATGTVNLAANKNINGAVTTAVTNTGTLSLLGGTQFVTGTVGLTGTRLATVNAGVNDLATSNFSSDVFATLLNVTGNGAVNLNGNMTGDTIRFQEDGFVNLADTKVIDADVTNVTGTAGRGTLTFVKSGAMAAGQDIGSSVGTSLKLVNISDVAGTAGTVTTDSIFASTTAINNGSTLNVRSTKNITGAVTTETTNTGTLNMEGGTQSIIGVVGGSGKVLNLVNVGSVATGSLTTDTIWATTTALNNSSTLSVRSGQDINGKVSTATANTGILTLQGGTQTVTGTVGETRRLTLVNAGANAAATSNFSSDVFATTLNVSGAGTVNLNGNFTGDMIYQAAGTSGLVNLAATKNITGAVVTATANTGTLTLLGGTQTVSGTVGLTNRLATVNAGVNAATSNFGNDVFATQLNVSGTGTVNLAGHFTGTSIHYQAAGSVGNLNMASGKNITGAVTTATTNTGILTMAGGAQAVSGNVGASGASLATVNVAADSAVTTLNGMVYATTLNFSGNGTAVLNGTNGGAAVGGLVGTADFNGGTGELQIGDNVNLTTGVTGIQFADANMAAMRFNGSSTVTGEVGAAATGANLANSTLKSIYAGVATKTVTFANDVHVSNSTFHVSGTGTVNLQGDLYGPLVYDADGVVNVSNGKSIRNDGTAAVGLATTVTNNTGTLNYLGNTTLSNDLGTSAVLALKAVNFHSDASVAAVSQTINKNIYATKTTIGNATTGTTANITANVYLGQSLELAAANVTLNTANQDVAQVAAGARIAGANANTLTFANTALPDGRLSTTATVTNSTTGTGAITTNGATLNFSVAAQPWAANAGGALNAAAASSVTGGAGSTLVMNGSEKVNVALLGSLKNNQSHTLVNVAAASGAQTGTATDNSYVIDSVLSRDSTGDLVVTFNRNSNTYITKSATAGHSSNAAAVRLGELGVAGTAYNADMQLVLNKLDLDQWGYGNNQANLATQVKRLAPIANNSAAQAALASTASVLTSVGERLSVLRGDVAMAGLNGNGRQMGSDNTGWVKVLGSNSTAKAIGQYDGYKVTNSGLVAGADAKVGNGVVGGSFSYVTSNISQHDFRLGDSGKMNSGTLAIYGTQEYGDAFVDAALAFSQHSLDNKRVTALARLAQADVDMNQTTLKLSAGYRIGMENSKVNVLTPMVSVEAANLKQKAYTETGADALSLNVDSKNGTRTRTSLGLRFNTVIEGATNTFYPELMVAMNRNQGMSNTDVVSNYMGDSSVGKSFTTTGAVLPKSSYTLAAGLRFATSKTSEFQIGYRYEGGSGLASNTAQLRGAWSF